MWSWRSLFPWLQRRPAQKAGNRRLEVAWTADECKGIWHRALDEAPREGAVVALCARSTGRGRDTIIVRRPIEPDSGYLSYHRGGLVSLTSRYWNRAIDLIAEAPRGTGIAVLHTHPGKGIPTWSRDDNVADEQLARFFYGEGIMPPEAPLLSLVGSHDQLTGRELMYSPSTDTVTMRPVERVRTIAPDRFELRFTTAGHANSRAGALGEYADRSIRVFGKEGQRLLANLHVAVVGTGGVGSIVAEHLARMGFGTLSLWDPDVVKSVNINRSAVFSFDQAKRHQKKVHALVAALPGFSLVRDIQLHSSAQDVRNKAELMGLLDADLIVLTVDDPRPRHFINQLAYAHYIPVFDGGNAIKSTGEDDGAAEHSVVEEGGVRVNLLVPGGPCLWCAGHLNPRKLSLAFRTPEDIAVDRARGYVENLGPEHAPSVMPVNALTAALLEIRLQDFLYNLSGQVVPETYFSLTGNTLDTLPRTRNTDCRHCMQIEGVGDAAELAFA